jgi:hypothetical protein
LDDKKAQVDLNWSHFSALLLYYGCLSLVTCKHIAAKWTSDLFSIKPTLTKIKFLPARKVNNIS